MFQALKNFTLGSKNKVITMDEVVASAEATFAAIHNDVIPTIKQVVASQEYFNSDNTRVLGNMGHSLGLRTSKPEEVVSGLLAFFKEVAAEERNLKELITTTLGDKIFPTMASARELAVMRTVSDLASATLYVLDLMYYIMLPKDTEYPKKKVDNIRSSLPYFTSIVSNYRGNFDKHVKQLEKVSKVVVKLEADGSMMDSLFAKHGVMLTFPTINGFIGNPIYHIRLWFVDRDVSRYEALKDKKVLIEQRLLDIKLQAGDVHDEKVAKQISYYEDKIAGIEYDIKEAIAI